MRGLVIIPAYNEAKTIGGVLDSLRAALPTTADILVVDDCSRDDTAHEARKGGIRLCSLPCNLGYTLALKTGLRYGLSRGYEWFAFMDADGQHRPEDMVSLISHFTRANVDLVIGSRWMAGGSQGKTVGSGRRCGMLFFSWLTRTLTGRRLTDTTSGMKIMNSPVAKELLAHNFGDFHSEVLIYLHDRGYSMDEHPITVCERTSGFSMYSLKDVIVYPLKNLILIVIFKLNSWTLRKVT
jgi:glycosyltransferase involved in cell wall biosynthesis